ncbi:hypothetical protein [Bradyrhizobium elkanii]|uniref:hypothetical protein n=1 Tax=Bradyrhizobium elkanii TaxID=29448 RepID=UPI00084148D9|nr:hypothetical protein [Bradyrhizobium elkanii]MCP1966443.1 hypothetical protein [Bradyrhizobium elkanii]MCS3522607.1 hypothetical protein [Bradyrhizobium elkanii]MCS4070261.1 hypothetical protein [Bradyrhizobium elkanii]MCS4076892.1 hypothetical protein [Bradyrhizobium elkanii]MCS4112053.1 hypothetical protein [Bradyrhizobium elkanii]
MIFAVIAFGLVSALLGDGIWDQASWLAFAVLLVVIAFCTFRRSARSSQEKRDFARAVTPM